MRKERLWEGREYTRSWDGIQDSGFWKWSKDGRRGLGILIDIRMKDRVGVQRTQQRQSMGVLHRYRYY